MTGQMGTLRRWLRRGSRPADPEAPTARAAEDAIALAQDGRLETARTVPTALDAVDDRATRRLLTLAQPALVRQRAPRLTLLIDATPDATPGHAPDPDLVAAARTAFPSATVCTVPVGDPAALHVELAAIGPHDAIIDATGDPEGVRATRAAAVLRHVRRGGVLVVRDAGAAAATGQEAPGQPSPGSGSEFTQLLTRAFEASLGPAPGRSVKNRSVTDPWNWGRAVGAAAVSNGHLVISHGISALAKIREGEAAAYLARRGPQAGAVLVERPGSVVEHAEPVRVSAADDAIEYATRFEAPPLQLRRYNHVTCRPGQVVTQGRVLLPETYRHLARPRLTNRFVEELAQDFGRLPKEKPAADLAGAYFHLDSEYRGHFGHALTEQITRLWAWREAKQAEPELRALMLVNRSRTTIAEWEYLLYEAAGIDREDLVLAEQPVRVERLLAATPMFSQPEFVHEGLAEVLAAIGDRLAAQAPERDYPRRIFCSRRIEKRACRNTPEVEEFFAGYGFAIVYPEDYPLGEQVQMFRRATDIAGFGGSGMFTTAFAREPKRVYLVSSENYRAQNESMIAALLGHQLSVAWCRPDKTRAAGYSGPEAMHSPYTFDAGREGRFLREVLEDSPARS